MKRIISLLILTALLLSVSACKRQPEMDSEGVQTGSANAAHEQQNKDGQKNKSEETIDDNTDKSNTNDTASEDNIKKEADNNSEVTDSSTLKEGMIVDSKLHSYIGYSAGELEDKAAVIMICRYDGDEVQVLPDETASDSYAGESFIDRYVTPLKVAKGDVADSVAVRTRGGVRDNVIYSSDEVTLEKGRSYFLYLKEGSPVRKNDNIHYKMFSGGTQGCIPINDDGTLDTAYIDAEDIEAVNRLYDSIK